MAQPGMSKVMQIARERPWLLLILYKVLDLGGGTFTARDIAESLGIHSYVVQRALWWLKKYGFVEEVTGSVPRKYKLKSVEDPYIEKLRMNRWRCGNTYLFLLDDIYVVLIVREDNIVARLIHRNIVEAIREAISKLGAESKPEELSKITGHDIKTVVTALRVLNTIDCRVK